VYIPSQKVALVEVPKCASRSLKSAVSSSFPIFSIGDHATLSQYKAAFPQLHLGCAVIREPMERLKSAAQYIVSDRNFKKNLLDLRSDLDGSLRVNRPELLNLLLYPQYSFLVCHAPVRLYTIEALPDLLQDLGVNFQAPVENKARATLSVEEVSAAFGEEFIKSFYAIDFALYDHLTSCQRGVMDVDDAKDYFHSLR